MNKLNDCMHAHVHTQYGDLTNLPSSPCYLIRC